MGFLVETNVTELDTVEDVVKIITGSVTGKRVVLEVELELDPVPGKYHQPEDFVELMKAVIPDYYLKNVKILTTEQQS